MEKTKLWEAINTLTAIERRSFAQWVQSPFFTRQERAGRLLDYLIECVNGKKTPDKEEGYTVVFPETTYDDVQMRLVISELYKLLEHFFVYQELFGDAENYPTALASAYRKRGLDRHFKKAISQARQAREAQPHEHAEYFSGTFEVEFQDFQHLSSGRRTASFNIQELSDLEDTAFIARKLRLTCIALSHQTVYQANYDLGMLEAVLEQVRRKDLMGTPAIGLYYFGYYLITQPEAEEHFTHFKKLMLSQGAKLPHEEQRNLYLMAINYCIKKVNALNQAYYREALDLYEFALANQLLLDRGKFSPFAFNNIVAIALKVGEVDWTERFVIEQSPHLERKSRNATYHLNLARVEYVRRDFKKALLHLQEADYKDLINNLISKTLQLKIFVQLAEYDLADAHLNALHTYIRRQRVMGYHRTNFLNMVRHTRALMNLSPNDDVERQALRARIEAEEILTEKEWLLKMLE
ncbi:MAG: hypothetical protein R2830_03935 [Saprospiraceae bacterium]